MILVVVVLVLLVILVTEDTVLQNHPLAVKRIHHAIMARKIVIPGR